MIKPPTDYVMIQLKFGPTKHCVEWTVSFCNHLLLTS